MSFYRDGGQAYPVPPDANYGRAEKGMSLRDHFAAQALPALVAAHVGSAAWTPYEIASHAYLIADALLARRLEVTP